VASFPGHPLQGGANPRQPFA